MQKISLLLALSLGLVGCASNGYSGHSKSYESPTYLRNTQGQTVYKIQDGNVFKPNGERVARIDSSGTVWSPTGSRLGKITKR